MPVGCARGFWGAGLEAECIGRKESRSLIRTTLDTTLMDHTTLEALQAHSERGLMLLIHDVFGFAVMQYSAPH